MPNIKKRSQIEELKEKQGNEENLKEDDVTMNSNVVNIQELFYNKLNEIKKQHDELLNFPHRVQMKIKE
jgi:hypothetical protein